MESLLIRSQAPLPIGGTSCTYLGKICDKLVLQSHFLLAISPCLRLPHQAVSIISPPGHLRLSSAAGAKGRENCPASEWAKRAHRSREECSLELQQPRYWRSAALPFPDRSEKVKLCSGQPRPGRGGQLRLE